VLNEISNIGSNSIESTVVNFGNDSLSVLLGENKVFSTGIKKLLPLERANT
jgi:hypothetical protein